MAVSVEIISIKVFSPSSVVPINAPNVLVISIGGVQSTGGTSKRQRVIVVEPTEKTESTANCRNRSPFVSSLFSSPVLGVGVGSSWDEDGTGNEGERTDLDDVFHVHLLCK